MDTNTVKQSVIDTYGKLAKQTKNRLFSNLFSCCDPIDTAQQVGKAIGYKDDELSNVPEGSNLGVGCGNPSALLNLKEGETIIDLGSGAGFDAFIVSPIVGDTGRVIGIDLSDDMLNLAKKNQKTGNYNNVEFIKGDIEKLPLEDNIADGVMSNCVINLSLNKGDIYKEAYRVLKKGGKISVSDIILEKELPNLIKNYLAGHIACISGAETLDTYLNYVKRAGFQNIQIRSKAEFPLELILTDPQIMKIAKAMRIDLNSSKAKDLASRVKSISITAIK